MGCLPIASTRRRHWQRFSRPGSTTIRRPSSSRCTTTDFPSPTRSARRRVTDSRNPTNSFPATAAGSRVTFTDTLSGVTFTFNDSGNNPITAEFAYARTASSSTSSTASPTTSTRRPSRVEAISYLPETTQYAFVPADGNTYLIHYNDVSVVFPVVSGADVNVGVATVGSDIFTVHADEVAPASGGAAIPINLNSFEINGNLYTITGHDAGLELFTRCAVVGAAMTPRPFLTPNTFQLTDPIRRLHAAARCRQPAGRNRGDIPGQSSRDLINVNDNIYLITYNTVSTGSLLGQGQGSIAIANSSFTLGNPFDSTKAKFIFADAEHLSTPHRSSGSSPPICRRPSSSAARTYTLDPVNLVVADNDKRPYPLHRLIRRCSASTASTTSSTATACRMRSSATTTFRRLRPT